MLKEKLIYWLLKTEAVLICKVNFMLIPSFELRFKRERRHFGYSPPE